MAAYREPGWWLPIEPNALPAAISETKVQLTEFYNSRPTGLDEVSGACDGERFEVRVGELYRGARVVAILERNERLLYVVTHNGRDFAPRVVGRHWLDVDGKTKH